jgi:hypothetical protein
MDRRAAPACSPGSYVAHAVNVAQTAGMLQQTHVLKFLDRIVAKHKPDLLFLRLKPFRTERFTITKNKVLL